MQATTLHIACDHAGLSMKAMVSTLASKLGWKVVDHGTQTDASVDYPDFAHAVCVSLRGDEDAIGVLICGTGIGMSIAANRHEHVRAALCGDVFSAEATRAHNNANVLCLGARVLGEGHAETIVRTFLSTPFEGGRHQRRIDKLSARHS